MARLILILNTKNDSRESSVGVTMLSAGESWVRIPAVARGFSLLQKSRPALGPTQPPVQWLPGVIRPGREAE